MHAGATGRPRIPRGSALVVVLDEGVFLRAELDAKRRAGEVELLAEEAFEIAAVAFADVLEGVAVNHDDRRIRAALVREAGLRTAAAGARGLLALDGLEEGSRELGRRNLAVGRGGGPRQLPS